MRISLNWLKQYVDVRSSPEELAERLTMLGLEVENIEHLGDKYKGFVVGEVLEVNKHPNADKLSVCSVNVGKEILQIVCGAPNVAPKQKVAVGLIGAEIPHNQHDPNGKPFVLSHVKIRGTDSYGMICSAHELDLGEDKGGILVLGSSAKIGQLLSQYLGQDDVVFEVGITPNRPDAMSHIGIAREVASSIGKKLRLPNIKLRESKLKSKDCISVKILDNTNCPRYSARVIRNVTLGPSPKWMQELLQAIGVRPVNNIVDISNYVLMEYGHPLHAFDYDKLTGKKIIVKCADEEQSFTTLDHKERKLRKDSLMICDGNGAVAIAGIMGGMNTEISDTTTNVLIESAYFNPTSIRRTSKFLGLSTDASQRFERGTNPNITVDALDRAASLIHELCGGEVLKGVVDVYPKKITPKKILLRVQKVNEILDTSLDAKTISSLLNKIEITSALLKNDKLNCVIPTFRPDIEREIDLIEEVARLYGYDNIETKTRTSFQFSVNQAEKDLNELIRSWLAGRGFNEIVTNSMQDDALASLASTETVKVKNPISKDMASLRTSLIPNILQVVRNNVYHGSKNLHLYEIGRVYFHAPTSDSEQLVRGFTEKERLLLAFHGLEHSQNWDSKARNADIFDVKGELEALFKKLSLDNCKFIPYSNTKALTDSGLLIEINGVRVGEVGAVKKSLLQKFDIEQDVIVAELELGLLRSGNKRKYQPLPKYPSVMRDLALVVDESLAVETLIKEIKQSSGPLSSSIELFDIYRGNQIDNGKKSCAFSLEFRSNDHTLTQEEIDKVMQNVVKHASSKFNATLRA